MQLVVQKQWCHRSMANRRRTCSKRAMSAAGNRVDKSNQNQRTARCVSRGVASTRCGVRAQHPVVSQRGAIKPERSQRCPAIRVAEAPLSAMSHGATAQKIRAAPGTVMSAVLKRAASMSYAAEGLMSAGMLRASENQPARSRVVNQLRMSARTAFVRGKMQVPDEAYSERLITAHRARKPRHGCCQRCRVPAERTYATRAAFAASRGIQRYR